MRPRTESGQKLTDTHGYDVDGAIGYRRENIPTGRVMAWAHARSFRLFCGWAKGTHTNGRWVWYLAFAFFFFSLSLVVSIAFLVHMPLWSDDDSDVILFFLFCLFISLEGESTKREE